MEGSNLDLLIRWAVILYIYILPPLVCIWFQIYIYIYKRKFKVYIPNIKFLGVLILLSTLGVGIVTLIEGFFLTFSCWGCTPDTNDFTRITKYFIWATINYILILRQIYLFLKIKNWKEK